MGQTFDQWYSEFIELAGEYEWPYGDQSQYLYAWESGKTPEEHLDSEFEKE